MSLFHECRVIPTICVHLDDATLCRFAALDGLGCHATWRQRYREKYKNY